MGEPELGRRVGTRRVVTTDAKTKQRVVHYVKGDFGGGWVYTACGKQMNHAVTYGGNGVPLCQACKDGTA